MSAFKKIAAGLTILQAVWVIYMHFTASSIFCTTNALCLDPQLESLVPQVLLGLGVLLVAVGLLEVWGASLAFLAGAVLSGALVIAMGYLLAIGYWFLVAETNQALVGTGLAAVALLADILAPRTGARLSEQANPMNLPVFG